MLYSLSILLSLAATFYVSRNGDNTDGSSYAHAWTNISSVTGVTGGDTVKIDGGTNQMYYQPLTFPLFPGVWVPKSGSSASSRVTYMPSDDVGHNGTVYFVGDGTNSCFQYQGGVSNIVITGNNGDGIKRLILTNYPGMGIGQGYVNVHISHIGTASSYRNGIDFNPSAGVEIDHCNFPLFSNNIDHLSFGSFTDSAYTNKWHNNNVTFPRGTLGIGPDILQWNGVNQEIHHDIWNGYDTNYVGGQHQDGWQATSARNVSIHDMKVTGIRNYAFFGDGLLGGFTNITVYNLILTDCGGGVIIGVDGGASDGSVFDGMRVANVTIDNLTNNLSQCVTIGNVTGHTATFLNSFIQNCVAINGAATPFDTSGSGGGVTTNANYFFTQSQALSQFVNYLGLDYTPVVSSFLVNSGVNLSAYFTTDFNGVIRTVPWSVGALLPTGNTGNPGIRVTRQVKFSGAINLKKQ